MVFAVPDPRTGDQVMAAVELRDGAAFDAGAFTDFLSAQPDLGTKWAPTYLRVVDAIPTTATGKIDRKSLRAEGWRTEDRVWWRQGRALDYVPLTRHDLQEIERAFEAAQRGHLMP